MYPNLLEQMLFFIEHAKDGLKNWKKGIYTSKIYDVLNDVTVNNILVEYPCHTKSEIEGKLNVAR